MSENDIDTPIEKRLVDILYAGNDYTKGHKVNHAKGILLKGTFTPSLEASIYSIAPHFKRSVPVIVRLSNATGVRDIEDQNPRANPRGIAIRFLLPDQHYTDLIGHSVEAFPADTPSEFMQFLTMANMADRDPEQFNRHISKYPVSQRFLSLLADIPLSYANIAFFPLHAFKFTNKEQVITIGRYQLQPVAGIRNLSPEQATKKNNNYLTQELVNHLETSVIQYRLMLQIANPQDDLMRISQPWHGDHQFVELGMISLDTIMAVQDDTEQKLLFDPTRLTLGIESVGDPMFAIRSHAYQISAQRRFLECLHN